MLLITGIAGFIGSHLAEKIRHQPVVGIDNFNDYYDPQIKRGNLKTISNTKEVVLEEGDIRDKAFLDKVFSRHKITTVVHLAAMAGVRPSLKNPLLYEEVNIRGTVNLLECMKQHAVRNYVFASSSSVYGECKTVPFREDMQIDRPISFYAATKKACEELNHVYSTLYQIKTVNLRFFTVYGPRQRPDLAIYKFTEAVLNNKEVVIYGDGSFKRDFTYIDDIIDGLSKAVYYCENTKDQLFEVFNLGESKTISVNELIEKIEKITGKKAIKKYQPNEPGDVSLTYADISRAKKALGYNPVFSIDKGLENFISWYKEKKY